MEREQVAMSQRRLEELPESVLQSRPRAAIYYAFTLFFSGLGSRDSASVFQRAEDYLQQAEQSLDNSEDSNDERGMIFAVRTSMASVASAQKDPLSAERDLAYTIQCGEKALEYLPESNLTWRCVVNLSLDQPLAPWRETEYLTLARVLIAQGQTVKAMPDQRQLEFPSDDN